jgi:hypothetical protein
MHQFIHFPVTRAGLMLDHGHIFLQERVGDAVKLCAQCLSKHSMVSAFFGHSQEVFDSGSGQVLTPKVCRNTVGVPRDGAYSVMSVLYLLPNFAFLFILILLL